MRLIFLSIYLSSEPDLALVSIELTELLGTNILVTACLAWTSGCE